MTAPKKSGGVGMMIAIVAFLVLIAGAVYFIFLR